MSFVRSLSVLLISLGAFGACAGRQLPASHAAPKAHAAEPLHEGPLTDYVPAAGLRWMVVGQPRRLASHPALAPALALLLPKERLDAFAVGSGVDLRQLDHALVAGFDYSTLYVFDPPQPAKVEERFLARLVSDPVKTRPHPQITRLTGLVGDTPQTFVRLDDRLVAISVGSAMPARVVELYARKRLHKSPPALEGSALLSLPRDLERAPLRFYAPGPFGGDWTRGARGLLAAATAVGAAATPLPDGRIEARILIAGDWSNAMAESAVRAAWDDLAQSGIGKLLGLNDPAAGPRIELGSSLIGLGVELDALTLARGLRAAVEADVWEILDIPRPR